MLDRQVSKRQKPLSFITRKLAARARSRFIFSLAPSLNLLMMHSPLLLLRCVVNDVDSGKRVQKQSKFTPSFHQAAVSLSFSALCGGRIKFCRMLIKNMLPLGTHTHTNARQKHFIRRLFTAVSELFSFLRPGLSRDISQSDSPNLASCCGERGYKKALCFIVTCESGAGERLEKKNSRCRAAAPRAAVSSVCDN